eukprot:2933470-Prymnesium_polylepis.1
MAVARAAVTLRRDVASQHLSRPLSRRVTSERLSARPRATAAAPQPARRPRDPDALGGVRRRPDAWIRRRGAPASSEK